MCKQFFFDDLSSPHVPQQVQEWTDRSGRERTARHRSAIHPLQLGLRDSRAGGLAMRLGV